MKLVPLSGDDDADALPDPGHFARDRRTRRELKPSEASRFFPGIEDLPADKVPQTPVATHVAAREQALNDPRFRGKDVRVAARSSDDDPCTSESVK